MEARNSLNQTPLHEATAEGHAHCVAALLALGAAREALDQARPLCSGPAGSHSIDRLLLRANAQPHPAVLSQRKRTPLHFAALYGKEECMTLLVGAGAVIDAQDEVRFLPLLLF